MALFDVARVTHGSVAKAAGVSERTVFRHFPTVTALHEAFAEHQEQRFGRDSAEDFQIDDLPEAYERWPERLEGSGGLELLLASYPEPPITLESRKRRYARLERALAPLVPDATPTQLRQLVMAVGALVSPEVFRRGKLVFDMNPEEIVPGPAWAIRVLIEKLREGDTPWT